MDFAVTMQPFQGFEKTVCRGVVEMVTIDGMTEVDMSASVKSKMN
jgi:hypothetical protein